MLSRIALSGDSDHRVSSVLSQDWMWAVVHYRRSGKIINMGINSARKNMSAAFPLALLVTVFAASSLTLSATGKYIKRKLVRLVSLYYLHYLCYLQRSSRTNVVWKFRTPGCQASACHCGNAPTLCGFFQRPLCPRRIANYCEKASAMRTRTFTCVFPIISWIFIVSNSFPDYRLFIYDFIYSYNSNVLMYIFTGLLPSG